MKVTNTEHTAINGNHSKCRMTPFSCALCAFARVLSRRCLLLIALYISRQAAKVARTIYTRKIFVPSAQPMYVLCLTMQGFFY